METPDPVIVTTKTALTAAVAAAVEKSVSDVVKRLEESRNEEPAFGWVPNERACELLQLSRPTLARYRADGTLPYAKWGQSVYYKLADLEALLEARMVDRASAGDGSAVPVPHVAT